MTSLIKNRVFTNKLPRILSSSFIISTASLCTIMATAAPIYKIVDEKTGQVTFTDRPQNHAQQAGKQVSQMVITTGNETNRVNSNNTSSNNASGYGVGSNGASNQPSNMPQTTAVAVTSTKAQTPVNYQLAITEPSEERAYRRPAQNIDVTVQVSPALQAGDTVGIYFDNKEVAQGLNTSLATVDIFPGAHEIKAVIKNEKGEALQQVSRTIHVIQNNTTLQNNKKIAKQLLAYQNLPWHQKVMLRMRQKEGAKP